MDKESRIIDFVVQQVLTKIGSDQTDGCEVVVAVSEDMNVGSDPRRQRMCRKIMEKLMNSRGMRPVDVSLMSATNHEGEVTQSYAVIIATK